MPLRILAIGVCCVVVLFSLGCSREREPREARLDSNQEAAARSAQDHSSEESRTDSIAVVDREVDSAEQAGEPVEQNEALAKRDDESVERIEVAAEQKANDWKGEDRPWTSKGVFSVNRPLDFERLASGIRQKYELEELDDPRLELDELLRLFEGGDSSVVFDLGLFLAYGDDLINDSARALEFFEEAAADGEARALAELGRLYLVGLGVPKDAALAESYFRQAMDEGDPEGAFLLGTGNRIGLFENSDTEKGMAYLETAAASGHDAAAIALLFVALDLRQFAEQTNGDKAEARKLALEQLATYGDMEKWLLEASDTGDFNSINALGRYYTAMQDTEKMESAYETAAELGSFFALNRLIDLRARELENPEFRDSMKELVSIHLEKEGSNISQVRFMMALLESFTASDAESKARIKELLEDAAANRHDKSFIALSEIESGEPELKAIIRAHLLKNDEAYLRKVKIKGKSKTGDGEYGSPTVPQLVNAVVPRYPAELKAEGIIGEVRVEFFVDREGRVYGVEAMESTHPAFSKSAIEAISSYDFSPAPNAERDATRFSLRLRFDP